MSYHNHRSYTSSSTDYAYLSPSNNEYSPPLYYYSRGSTMKPSHSQSSDSSGSVNHYPDSSSTYQEISPRRSSTTGYYQGEPPYPTNVPRQQSYVQYTNEPASGNYYPSSSMIQPLVSVDDRTHQTSKQPKVYPCLVPGCPSRAQFKRLADLERHQNTVHFPKFIDCPLSRCGRKGKHGFTRKDHLRDHMREVHMKEIAKKGKQEKSTRREMQ